MTKYTVLRRHTEKDWVVFETLEARSADQAIRLAVEALPLETNAANGTFVAIPSRSWEPKSVKVETRITLS